MMVRWFAKRFLHPDIVAEYSYIFLWDEDLGVESFNPERFVNSTTHLNYILNSKFKQQTGNSSVTYLCIIGI